MATAAAASTMLLFLSPVLLLAASAAGSNDTADNGSTLVFILAGQSNMGGRGGATSGTWDGVVPPQCASSPRILRLNPALQWEEAGEPLHAGIDLFAALGVGPGMPFAHAVLDDPAGAVPPQTVVGLVPCAQGASSIAQWSRGAELYNRMIARTRAALVEDEGGQAGKKKQLAAMLWYQGEADTVRQEDALAYASRMEAFVGDVRSDLNMADLLVIQVGLATGQGKFIDLVRQAQMEVNKLPNVKYVDAKGLPVANDFTHLTTPAQVQLGEMLAKAYLATLPPSSSTSLHRSVSNRRQIGSSLKRIGMNGPVLSGRKSRT